MNFKIVLVVFALMSCSASKEEEETITYHSYDEVADSFIDFSETLSKDNHYYVYCFSLTCKYCEEIRNEVIQIALKKQKTIYFCNKNIVKDSSSDPSTTIGVTDIKYLFVRGYPSLVEINDKTVKNNIVGKTNVIKELRT